MWNRKDFDDLNTYVPFTVIVDWDVQPSSLKYGYVNSLLAVIRALQDLQGTFFDANGNSLNTLTVTPIKRKITDKQKKNFSIVGHNTTCPLLIACLGHLQIEIYFNHYFFVMPNTGGHQYFPSASVILRPRNFLKWDFTPSPGSWGSDIISLSYDWDGTFVLEAAEYGVSRKFRYNFRGYKLVPTQNKFFLSPRRLPVSEQTFLNNNGFANRVIADSFTDFWPGFLKEMTRYIEGQRGRLK